MKYLLVLLLSAMAMTGFAQSKADYTNVTGRFKHFYNQQQGDSIVNMFALVDEAKASGMWTREKMTYLMKEFGAIKTLTYMGEEDGMILFRAICVKSVHIMGLVLREDNKMGAFRFKVNTTKAQMLLGNTP